MDEPESDVRLQRWRIAIHRALAPLELHLTWPARDIANLDRLIDEDVRQFTGNFREDFIARILQSDDYPRRFGLSRFWVLGAYELVRTIEQLLRPQNDQSPIPIHLKAIQLKRQFERLRMPLAKLEAARRHPKDWPIAYPAMNPTTGAIGWNVSHSDFIERRQLADSLLEFLEDLAAHNQPRD